MDPTISADGAQHPSSPAGGTATSPAAPISDPDDRRHRGDKMKSFSQPIFRNHPSFFKKKQNSLELSSPASSPAGPAISSGRSYSYRRYPPPNPLTARDASDPNSPLPEFTGSGGGTGIFKLPLRAPMHPGRPPPVELRPRPLRETQVGSFLRSIACTHTQLWAATERGVRFWELSKVFGEYKGRRSGDEESAPFSESIRTPPALCLVVDERRGLVWTGHKDGRIRSWKINEEGGDDGDEKPSPNFKEGLSWHAHRSAVLSLVLAWNGNFDVAYHMFVYMPASLSL